MLAAQPVESARHRIMIWVLHRSSPLMQRMLALIRKRRNENDYYKVGRLSVQSTVIAKTAAHKLSTFIKKRMAAKTESRASLQA